MDSSRIARRTTTSRSVFALSTLLLLSPLVLSGGQPSEAETALAPTGDWYNPPPKEYRGVAAELLIPTELICAVYAYRMEEATAILGSATMIEITKERATYLAAVGDPGTTIPKELNEAKEQLQYFVERRRRGHHNRPKKIREQLDVSDERIIEELKREITGYEQWGKDAKPYLIKAVVGGGSGIYFGATVADKLFLTHVAVGQGPLEIKRMPVVAYLPKRPQYVYHVLSGME